MNYGNRHTCPKIDPRNGIKIQTRTGQTHEFEKINIKIYILHMKCNHNTKTHKGNHPDFKKYMNLINC